MHDTVQAKIALFDKFQPIRLVIIRTSKAIGNLFLHTLANMFPLIKRVNTYLEIVIRC